MDSACLFIKLLGAALFSSTQGRGKIVVDNCKKEKVKESCPKWILNVSDSLVCLQILSLGNGWKTKNPYFACSKFWKQNRQTQQKFSCFLSFREERWQKFVADRQTWAGANAGGAVCNEFTLASQPKASVFQDCMYHSVSDQTIISVQKTAEREGSQVILQKSERILF